MFVLTLCMCAFFSFQQWQVIYIGSFVSFDICYNPQIMGCCCIQGGIFKWKIYAACFLDLGHLLEEELESSIAIARQHSFVIHILQLQISCTTFNDNFIKEWITSDILILSLHCTCWLIVGLWIRVSIEMIVTSLLILWLGSVTFDECDREMCRQFCGCSLQSPSSKIVIFTITWIV